MKGSFRIRVYNRGVHYDFTLNRNITLIQGDSGTGKTTLIDTLRDAINGQGTQLESKHPCVVLENSNWKLILKNTTDSFVFLDETFRDAASVKFAEYVRDSGNYFVVISRDCLPSLPYSYQEIYDIKTSGKFYTLQPRYEKKLR